MNRKSLVWKLYREGFIGFEEVEKIRNKSKTANAIYNYMLENDLKGFNVKDYTFSELVDIEIPKNVAYEITFRQDLGYDKIIIDDQEYTIRSKTAFDKYKEGMPSEDVVLYDTFVTKETTDEELKAHLFTWRRGGNRAQVLFDLVKCDDFEKVCRMLDRINLYYGGDQNKYAGFEIWKHFHKDNKELVSKVADYIERKEKKQKDVSKMETNEIETSSKKEHKPNKFMKKWQRFKNHLKWHWKKYCIGGLCGIAIGTGLWLGVYTPKREPPIRIPYDKVLYYEGFHTYVSKDIHSGEIKPYEGVVELDVYTIGDDGKKEKYTLVIPSETPEEMEGLKWMLSRNKILKIVKDSSMKQRPSHLDRGILDYPVTAKRTDKGTLLIVDDDYLRFVDIKDYKINIERKWEEGVITENCVREPGDNLEKCGI